MSERRRANAEEDYKKTPVSVLRYVTDLEVENEILKKELGEHRRNAALRWEKYKDPKATLYECKQRVGGEIFGIGKRKDR